MVELSMVTTGLAWLETALDAVDGYHQPTTGTLKAVLSPRYLNLHERAERLAIKEDTA
jgi:hypothetical protein